MNSARIVRLLMGWSLTMVVVTFGVPAGAQGTAPSGSFGLEDVAASCSAPAPHGMSDVPPTNFADLAIGWLVEAGITSGTAPGQFSPSNPVTRAQMAVFLWSANGKPTPVGLQGFTDVPADHFASTAVAWLVETGITAGTGPDTYSPSNPVTRAEMAVFLWRAADQPTPAGPHGFDDVPADHFADTAVAWLVGQEITSGTGPGAYSPDNPVTRAQMAVFLWRSACQPSSGGFTMLTITDDGSYSFDESNGVVDVTNELAGSGANTRVIVAQAGSPPDSVCATIESVTGAIVGFAQPGVALHVRTTEGRTTALTLTNNVWANARWGWNVHSMDSGSVEGFTGLGSFTAPGFYGLGDPLPPLPWRVCARTVGDTVQGKVWEAGDVEPAWGDRNFGGSIAIPSGLATGGESGVYAAHLGAGQGFRFSNVGPAGAGVTG